MAAVLIKKYGNRRLYDTGDSKYVTLEELAVKVRSGAELRVVDAQNGDDLTQATLAQIVLETGHAAKFLPVQLLTQMIRLSDDALAEFFSRYVTNALDLYMQAKRGVQSISAYNPLAQMWMGTPFAQYAQQPPQQYNYSAPPYVAPPPLPHDDEPNGDRGSSPKIPRDGDRDDVAAMRRELDELKQAIRDGFAAKTPPPRKRRKP